jgi:hypothetical protein
VRLIPSDLTRLVPTSIHLIGWPKNSAGKHLDAFAKIGIGIDVVSTPIDCATHKSVSR